MSIDTAKKYTATFNTSRGEIVCELFPKDAPKTVSNFVFLARDHFYDGTVFHRVIENFMIQGGDPEGSGRGASPRSVWNPAPNKLRALAARHPFRHNAFRQIARAARLGWRAAAV